MFAINNIFAKATNNTSAETKSMDMSTLKSTLTNLYTSVTKGLTFNGEAYKYQDLLATADTINADIIGNVFAVTNIAARLTGLIALEDMVGSIMANLPENPSMEDIKVMFDRINGVFENQLALAEQYQNIENIQVLKQVCGGKSAFHYAYAGINALYGKLVKTLGKHMPKVELKNKLLINLSAAIHRVGEVLWSGVKLVLKGLRMGLSFAAALAIQCGRVVLKAISTAVEWVRTHIPTVRVVREEVVEEDVDANMAEAMAAMEENFQNYVWDKEEVAQKQVILYQAATQEGMAINMIAGHTGAYTDLHDMVATATVLMDGEDSDILEACFELFNNSPEYKLPYSMSVGDVLSVDGRLYRCTFNGWNAIQG